MGLSSENLLFLTLFPGTERSVTFFRVEYPKIYPEELLRSQKYAFMIWEENGIGPAHGFSHYIDVCNTAVCLAMENEIAGLTPAAITERTFLALDFAALWHDIVYKDIHHAENNARLFDHHMGDYLKQRGLSDVLALACKMIRSHEGAPTQEDFFCKLFDLADELAFDELRIAFFIMEGLYNNKDYSTIVSEVMSRKRREYLEARGRTPKMVWEDELPQFYENQIVAFHELAQQPHKVLELGSQYIAMEKSHLEMLGVPREAIKSMLGEWLEIRDWLASLLE